MTTSASPPSRIPPASRPGSRSLARRLIALAAALLVPLNLFLGLVLWRYASAEQGAMEARARHTAQGVTTAVEREITGIVRALEVLATSPHLVDGDLAAFHRQASQFARREGGFHVSLRDGEGRALVSTRVSPGKPVPGGPGNAFYEATREAARLGRPVVSEVYIGPMTGKPSFTVSVPVPAGIQPPGSPPLVLNASLEAALIAGAMEREGLPEGWTGAVVDQRGHFIARSPDHEGHVGRLTSPDCRAKAVGEGGSYRGANTAGLDVLVGYARSRQTGWTFAVSVPGEAVSAPLRRSLLLLLGLGAALAAGAAALALALGRQVSRAVGRLVAAAGALGRGEAVPPEPTGLAETDAVARALADAAAGLELRERQRAAAERALRHLNATLEARVAERTAQVVQLQKLESLGQLTGGVAHDFNNLLMAVLASLELLQKRLGLHDPGIAGDPRIQRLIDNAMQGAERGAALTQRLLAFARRQELRPEAVDVPALVRGMRDLLASSLGPLVTVETRFPEHLPPARADAHQLENALLNLAVNARDAMPGGGRLTIGARKEVVGPADPGGLAPGCYVVLQVADTGSGMDAATLARAAEPFFTTKGVGKGTGLGLSMVHGLVAQSGGRLVLQSSPGQGTTAELWLPEAEAASAAAAQGGPGNRQGGTGQRGLTVLLIDDDPLVLRGTAAMLDDLGHAVTEAHSGRHALDLLREGLAADLAITDYAMPGMTGAQLAAEIGRLRPDLPVILATGYADLPAGSDPGLPRLAKPFRQEALAAIIEAALASPERRRRRG